MIRVAGEHGVALERCVAGTELAGRTLLDPMHEIRGQQELAVLRNILRALDPTIPFGLLAGVRYHTAMQGMFGFALVTSANMRAAIDIAVRYFDLSYSFNTLAFTLDAQEAHLIYDEGDNPDDLRAALVERDLGALVTMYREIKGEEIPIRSLKLRAQRPVYADAFEPIFGVVPQWNAEANRVNLDVATLEVQGPLANEVGLRLCEEQCRALLQQRRQLSGVAGGVRLRILRKPGEFPSMKTVAAELGMSTRTLRNQLGREATSYRQLVECARRMLAEELLTSTRLTVEEIAARVGYADPSSFIAAFKRWKGMSPRAFRRIAHSA